MISMVARPNVRVLKGVVALAIMFVLGQNHNELFGQCPKAVEVIPSPSDQDPDKDIISKLRTILDESESPPSLFSSLKASRLAKDRPSALKNLPATLVPRMLYKTLRGSPVDSPPGWGYQLVFFACQLSDYDRMGGQDKLICECASMRCALLDEFPDRSATESRKFLRDCFARFAKAMGEMDPLKAYPYLEDLILATAELVVKYPDLGADLGTSLRSVLERANGAWGHAQSQYTDTQIALRGLRQMVVDLDNGDLAATAHFYVAQRLICEALKADDILKRISVLKQRKERIKTHLLEGERLLHDKSRVWLPFKQYSDVLLDLYDDSKGQPFVDAERARLIVASSQVLYDGIRFYVDKFHTAKEAEENLQGARRELCTRVYRYATLLAADMRFADLICFASKFVDDKQEVLKDAGAEEKGIYAMLARANYLLDRPYEHYLKRSGGKVTEEGLKKESEDVGRFILSRGMSPCKEEDW